VTDLWWPIWHQGGRLEELDARECRRLLAGTAVGRLGYQTVRGPRIVPMNYKFVGDSIVTCTAPDTEIARFAVKQTVAFEIDQADEYLQRGWSVLVVGELRLVSAEAIRMLAPAQTPDPWPEGPRWVFLQLEINQLTGRRVHPA
jgi:uncharacterized protein